MVTLRAAADSSGIAVISAAARALVASVGGNGDSAEGGALFSDNGGVTILNSKIYQNSAVAGSGGNGGNALAPTSLGVHTMRARIAGKWARPIEVMAPEIRLAAEMLAECGPDLLVYNCTASSMREGPAGEKKIINLIKEATGIDTVSTSAVISEAFKAQRITSVVVISPYPNNDEIVGYLEATGIKVARSVALQLPTHQYGAVTPEKWRAVARENNVADADGIFLSCAATTQIEAVAGVEADLGKPVVNSNQAVLWGALKRLQGKLGGVEVTHVEKLLAELPRRIPTIARRSCTGLPTSLPPASARSPSF